MQTDVFSDGNKSFQYFQNLIIIYWISFKTFFRRLVIRDESLWLKLLFILIFIFMNFFIFILLFFYFFYSFYLIYRQLHMERRRCIF